MSHLRRLSLRALLLRSGLGVLLGFAGFPAFAQQTQGTPARLPAESLDEILITARRREESLQKAPLSVSILRGEDLRAHTLGRLDEIGNLVPNLRFDTATDGHSARIFLRGIGSDLPGDFTRDPGVGVYLDGVYLARSDEALLALADVERIEVLRGPQGTLYGRNTVGGAIQFISRKPEAEPGGELQVQYGNHAQIGVRGVLNLPLVEERVLSRLSIVSERREGYSRNVLRDERGNGRNVLGVRVALRMLPSDALTLDLSGDFSAQSETGRAGHCLFNDRSPAALGTLPNGVEFPTLLPLLDQASGFIRKCRESENLDTLDYAADVRGRARRQLMGASSALVWSLPDARLSWITGWRRVAQGREFQDVDLTGVRAAELGNQRGANSDQLGTEVNLSGRTARGGLDWTLGAYANLDAVAPRPVGIFSLVDLGSLPGFGFLDFSSAQIVDKRDHGLAGYAQLGWAVSSRLRATAGVRRLSERKSASLKIATLLGSGPDDAQIGPLQTGPDGAASRFQNADRFHAWLGLFNLQYELSPHAMMYAQWANGYKSGGRNSELDGRSHALNHYEPEQLDSFEIGLKLSTWSERLVLRSALFQATYSQIQQNRFTSNPDGTFVSRTENQGKARLRGAELELHARPLSELDLSASFGWLFPRFLDNSTLVRERRPGPDRILDGFVCGNGRVRDPAACQGLPPGSRLSSADDTLQMRDQLGLDFFNAPQFTAHVSAAYRFTTAIGSLTPRVSWYQQSAVSYAPLIPQRLGKQHGYGLLDGRLALELPDGKTEIALWAHNLLDRRYVNAVDTFDDGFGVSLAYPGAPRMYGIEIRRVFSAR